MTTQKNNGPQINAGVNFDEGRGYGSMGAGLHRNFFASDNKLLVGATIAALYHNPNDSGADGTRRTCEVSRAMVQLALYASGSAVTLDRKQFRPLERRVRRYASEMDCAHFEHTNNLTMARWVLKHAVARAKAEKVI